MTKRMLVGLLAAGVLVVGCSEESKGSNDAGTDTDTDTDSDTDSDTDTGDVCDDPMYGVEELCSLPSDPCPCDLYCNQEYTDAANQTQFYDGFYCYQTCDEEQTDESCPGEYDICYHFIVTNRHLCLVEGQITGQAWEAVIVPQDLSPTDADRLPADVTLTLGDTVVTFTEVVGHEGSQSLAEIILIFDGADQADNHWHMELKMPGDDWAPGTFEVWPAGSPWSSLPDRWLIAFAAITGPSSFQNQASGYAGEMVVTEANPPESCSTPPDCVTSSGEAFQIDIVGMKLILY